MLPQNIKDITDLEDFKHKIRTWIPENCMCRLCKDFVSNLRRCNVLCINYQLPTNRAHISQHVDIKIKIKFVSSFTHRRLKRVDSGF